LTIYIFDLEEIIFENFNISENNIISVKLAKVVSKGTLQLLLTLILLFSVYGQPHFIKVMGKTKGGLTDCAITKRSGSDCSSTSRPDINSGSPAD
jgi:hypothetical protein